MIDRIFEERKNLLKTLTNKTAALKIIKYSEWLFMKIAKDYHVIFVSTWRGKMEETMKKVFILFMFLSIIYGCSPNQNKGLDIQNISLLNLSEESNTEFKLLRTEKDKIILNELDTLDNPFLFATKSIIILDQNGKQTNKYNITTNKRIVDFIGYENNFYYFNLISKDNKYYIELCKMENNNEKIIENYDIKDPYAYPKFIQYNNSYWFKINDYLYNLDKPNDFIDLKSNYFFSKNDIHNNSPYIKIQTDSNQYQLCTLKGNEMVPLNLKMNFGNFIVSGDLVIYENNNDQYLYMYNLNDEKEKCIFNQETIIDFTLLENDIVAMNTEKTIHFMNITNNQIIHSMNKKEHSLEGIIPWIYSDGVASIYLIGDINLYKISIN